MKFNNRSLCFKFFHFEFKDQPTYLFGNKFNLISGCKSTIAKIVKFLKKHFRTRQFSNRRLFLYNRNTIKRSILKKFRNPWYGHCNIGHPSLKPVNESLQCY